MTFFEDSQFVGERTVAAHIAHPAGKVAAEVECASKIPHRWGKNPPIDERPMSGIASSPAILAMRPAR